MVIELRLHGELSRYAAEGAAGIMMIHISEEVSVKELLIGLSIDLKEVKAINVNGIKQELDYIMDDGDNLEIFSYT